MVGGGGGVPLRFNPSMAMSGEWVAGVDEVGRGALFGPVVAAVVVFPVERQSELERVGVQDSKNLSPRQRECLLTHIQSLAHELHIGLGSVQEIDRLNILQASLLAMRRAVLKCRCLSVLTLTDGVLVDGIHPIPDLPIPQRTWVQGDQHSVAIAAASIVAKVWRDALINRLAVQYPGYGLERHKGYGTPQHRMALRDLGCTPQHRKSFRPCQVASALGL